MAAPGENFGLNKQTWRALGGGRALSAQVCLYKYEDSIRLFHPDSPSRRASQLSCYARCLFAQSDCKYLPAGSISEDLYARPSEKKNNSLLAKAKTRS